MINRTVSILAAALIFLLPPSYAVAPEKEYLPCRAAVLFDMDSGRILYSKRPLERCRPASLSKLMTAYIILRDLHSGLFEWEDKVKIDAAARALSFKNSYSNVPLAAESYSVSFLFDSMIIASANASASVLAQFDSGAEKEFVREMNRLAGVLKMDSSVFFDCTGITNAYSAPGMENMTTPLDMSRLVYSLLKEYPYILSVSSRKSFRFSRGSENLYIPNWNRMLLKGSFYYAGLDGLKTGHTERAGYSIAATAEKKGRRLVAVIMASETREDSFAAAASLLDHGFTDYSIFVPELSEVPVFLASEKKSVKASCPWKEMPVYVSENADIEFRPIRIFSFTYGYNPSSIRAGQLLGFYRPENGKASYLYSENIYADRIPVYALRSE